MLLLLCTGTFFAGLGRSAITDSDEAFYAESAREMLEGGDWLSPRYNGEYRFQKPVLYYWLTAATYAVAGVHEAAARLWSALAGLGLVLLTWNLGRRWYGDPAGFAAGLVAATNFGYITMARFALPDLPLAFFATLATWAVVDADRRPRYGLAGFAAALGFLTKGPLGVILPAIVVVPVLASERRLGELTSRRLIAALAVFAIVGLPWYVLMAAEHGGSYLYGFFVGDNLERFATGRFNEPRPVWFYLPILAGGLLPWTPFVLQWIAPIRAWLRRHAVLDPRTRRLIIWTAAPLLLFSLSVGKQSRYILPVLPPLAVLLGASMSSADGGPRAARWAASLAGILLAALGVLVWRADELVPWASRTAAAAAAGVTVLAGLLVIGIGWSTRWRSVPATLAVATTTAYLAVHYGVLSSARAEPVQRIASAIGAHRHAGEPVASYRVFVRNLVFYTGLRHEDLYDEARLAGFLGSPGRVLCVLPARDLAAYERATRTRLPRLAEIRSFNPATAKVRTLVWPDPATDVDTVVLVSNR